jgi:hypothetical protein
VRVRGLAVLALIAAALPAVSLAAPSGRSAGVTVVAGTEDYAPGTIRVSFLLLGAQGAPVYRAGVRASIARQGSARPLASGVASLEPIGVPGAPTELGDVTRLYVVHLKVPQAGKYTVLVTAPGKTTLRGGLPILVRAHPQAPAVGSKAIASKTPTIASTHGDFPLLTTRVPPDKSLLHYSIAGALSAHKPFVVVFATPKFCSSRTCGPVVGVVDAVRKQFTGTAIRFIHVEVYEDNDPGKGFNRWFKQWHLPTEPWTFVVGRDGLIKARFEGSVSVKELAGAVRQYLAK